MSQPMNLGAFSRRHPRRLWVFVVGFFVVCSVAMVSVWLGGRMPPPVIDIQMVGFKEIDSKRYADVAIVNRGWTTVYLDLSGRNSGWRIHYATQTGGGATFGQHFADTSRGMGPGQSNIVRIAVPGEFERWRVTAPFMHFNRRHGLLEFRRWMLDNDQTNAMGRLLYQVTAPVISQLPVPSQTTAIYSSGWFTKPPEDPNFDESN